MNKHIIARKPCLTVVLLLALLALVFAVSLPKDQTALASTEARITPSDAQYNILSFDIDTGSYVPGTCMRVLNNQYPAITLSLDGIERSSSVVYQYVQRETIVPEEEFESLSWITVNSADWLEAILTVDE
ncbi:MAG: hypothetical protein PHI19_01440, partial [Clostridia bacterium]|nr:hypothetical protein [Clostridia bacterium]